MRLSLRLVNEDSGGFLSRNAVPVLMLVLVIALAGCGGGSDRGPTGNVTGQVTFNGSPVSEGTVIFVAMDAKGRGTAGKIGQEGKYTLDEEITVGSFKVYVIPPPPSGPGVAPPESPDIPVKYRSQLTSDLTADVTEGKNTIDLAMKE